MPQYYKDAFAKEHARIIGEGLGEFDDNLSISTETLDFDVLFIPNSDFLGKEYSVGWALPTDHFKLNNMNI